MHTVVSSRTSRYRPSDAVVARMVGEEMVLLDLVSGIYYSLNGVGAFIWRQIQEGRSEGEVVKAVVEVYDTTHALATEDVKAFLQTLVEPGLLIAQ